jgi:hypothetical protein
MQGELCEHFLFGNRKTEHHRKRTEMTDDMDDSRRCFVVVHITDSMATGQSCIRQSCKQTERNNHHLLSLSSSDFKVQQLGNVVVSLCGASGKHTSLGIVVGLLKYVGPQAAHFTGYCCWLMWGLGQHTLLGIVVGFMWGLGQHTLLGIVVWFM